MAASGRNSPGVLLDPNDSIDISTDRENSHGTSIQPTRKPALEYNPPSNPLLE